MEVDERLLLQELSALDSSIRELEDQLTQAQRKLLELTIRRDVIREFTQGKLQPTPPASMISTGHTDKPLRLDAALQYCETQQPLQLHPAPHVQPDFNPPPTSDSSTTSDSSATSTTSAISNKQPKVRTRAVPGLMQAIWQELGPFLANGQRTVSQCFDQLLANGAPINRKQQMYTLIGTLRANGWMMLPEDTNNGFYQLTPLGAMNIDKPAPTAMPKSAVKRAGSGKKTKTGRKSLGLTPANEAMLRYIGVTSKPTPIDVMDHMDRIGKPMQTREQLYRQIYKCRNDPYFLMKQADDTAGDWYELTDKGLADYGPDDDDVDYEDEEDGQAAQPALNTKTVGVLPRVIDPSPTSVIGNALSEAQRAAIDTDIRKEQIANVNKGKYGRSRKRRNARH